MFLLSHTHTRCAQTCTHRNCITSPFFYPLPSPVSPSKAAISGTTARYFLIFHSLLHVLFHFILFIYMTLCRPKTYCSSEGMERNEKAEAPLSIQCICPLKLRVQMPHYSPAYTHTFNECIEKMKA